MVEIFLYGLLLNFSMGMLSYFYADLQSGDQKYLAKELYGTSVACLKAGYAVSRI